MYQMSFLTLLTFVGLAMASNASAQEEKEVPKALNFKMTTLDGKEVMLAEKYKDKTVLFVNVASKCGLTPQYKDLQALHEKYGDKGLAIVGVPCNQFGGQEPGTASEIKEFCEANYGVEFDMMSKVDVNGEDQCDLYKYLTGLDLQPKGKGPIKWNFEKFIINPKGEPVARFEPRVKPTDEKFIEALESAMK